MSDTLSMILFFLPYVIIPLIIALSIRKKPFGTIHAVLNYLLVSLYMVFWIWYEWTNKPDVQSNAIVPFSEEFAYGMIGAVNLLLFAPVSVVLLSIFNGLIKLIIQIRNERKNKKTDG